MGARIVGVYDLLKFFLGEVSFHPLGRGLRPCTEDMDFLSEHKQSALYEVLPLV
jgi:hypothetical protein